jgi:hypothetical protein
MTLYPKKLLFGTSQFYGGVGVDDAQFPTRFNQVRIGNSGECRIDLVVLIGRSV